MTSITAINRRDIFHLYIPAAILVAASSLAEAQVALPNIDLDAIRSIEIAYVPEATSFRRSLYGPELFEVGCVYLIADEAEAKSIVRSLLSLVQPSENKHFDAKYGLKIHYRDSEGEMYITRPLNGDVTLRGRFNGNGISADIHLPEVLRARVAGRERTLGGDICAYDNPSAKPK